MLILSSNGLSLKELINEVSRYIPSNPRKAVIVTTVSVGYKQDDWHIPRISKELESLGFSIDFLDLEFQDPSL